jgi:predicted NACHT family NTPase
MRTRYRSAQDEPLALDTMMEEYGRTLAHALVIKASSTTGKRKRSDGSILDQLEELTVVDTESQLDALSEKQGSHTSTPELHSFWQGFGEFASSYLVLKEEVMLWKVVKRLFLGDDENRIVLVGSPGVGKSCLLMRFLAFA